MADRLFDELMSPRAQREDSTEVEKRHMLANPGVIDKSVANMADYLSPTASTKKPKGEMFGVDSVEASKDPSDPTVGFGIRLRDDFTKALMSPATKGIPAGVVLHTLADDMMKRPQEDGTSLLEKSYKMRKVEGSRLWGGVQTKAMPGEEAWLQDKKVQEKQDLEKESWAPSLGGIVEGTLGGAVLGAAVGASGGGTPGVLAGAASGAGVGGGMGLLAGGPVGGALGAGIGGVVGGIGGFFAGSATGALAGGLTGGVLGLGGELLAAPIKRYVHGTNWYQGMLSSNSMVDRAKTIAADFAAYLPGAIAAEKGLIKGAGNALRGLTGEPGEALSGLANVNSPVSKSGLSLNGMTGEVLSAAEEANLARPPLQTLIGYEAKTAQATTPGGGILKDAEGRTILQPAMDGEPTMAGAPSETKLLPQGVDTVQGAAPAGPTPFVPELPNLLEAGKGYERPGAKNLGRKDFGGEVFNPVDFGPNVPADLDAAGLKSFEEFKPLVREHFGEKPVSEQEMFNIWKERSDNTAAQGIEEAVQKVAKAKVTLAENPTAAKVMDVVKEKPGEIKPVPGSNIVEKSMELDDIGLKEAGLEPITQEDLIANPGLKKLDGPVSKTIPQAAERKSFVELGTENNDGPLRTALADAAKKNIKGKLDPIDVDSSKVVDVTTSVNPEVTVTPVEQAKAIKNVSDHSLGARTVEEEFFPETKAASFEDARKGYFESLGATDEASYIEKMRNKAEDRVIDRKSALDDKSVTTDGEVDKEFKALMKEEPSSFRAWARTTGVELPSEMKTGKIKLITGMAAMLGTAGAVSVLYDQLSGTKAEAGGFSSLVEPMVRAAVKEGTTETLSVAMQRLAKEALDKALISMNVEKGQTVLKGINLQTGLMQSPEYLKNLVNANLRAGKGAGAQYTLMSPYQTIEALFTTGKGKVINAATNLASFVTAGARNKDNAWRVTKNILDEGGVATNANAVKNASKPLIPLAAKATKYETAVGQLKDAESGLAKAMSKVDANDPAASAADVTLYQQDITRLRGIVEELNGSTESYHAEWNKIYQGLAKDNASVRVALALEDPGRTIYPWLPQLSRNEEVAVGKLRGLLDQYQVRLSERGIPTRDNYLPHSPHPDMAKIFNDEMKDVLGGAPYQEFYHRTENSRPLLADINYTMNHYLADIEPRIQNHDFWKRSGWNEIRQSAEIQANPGLKRAFDQLYEGSKPMEQTWGNVAAQRYSEFEAVNKLFLNPSAGLKHIIKGFADLATVGPKVFGKAGLEASGYVIRKALNTEYGINQTSIRSMLEKVGVKSDRFNRSLMDNFMDSALMSGNMRKYMLDMGIDDQSQMLNSAKNVWRGVQNVGAAWINLAELVDRGTSVSSGLQMAAKKGMTVDQAMYGTYDLILKNNFLFGQFNPAWLNNPKIRAFFMFQATPFKIFERRVVMAQRSGAGIGQLSSELQKVVKDPNQGWGKVLTDIKDMKAYMREGQSELKSNLFIDALSNETDFFGTPIIKQLATDMLTVGAATYGGAQVGLALSDHFFHIPFLSTQSEKGRPEVAVNPLISSTMKGYNAWKSREDGEDFLLGSIMRRWLGPYGPLPQTLSKAVRLNTGDIPEIYRKGGESGYLKYLFGVPGSE